MNDMNECSMMTDGAKDIEEGGVREGQTRKNRSCINYLVPKQQKWGP